MAKKTPEIPSASLADIAFLLLIFFMVTTTMDVDSGLERKLPPLAPDVEQDDSPPIKERNVFIVLVNKDNNILVEGQWTQLKEIREKAKEFMANPNNLETLPEKKIKEIEFFGPTEISEGVISLQNDLGTQYGTYLAVQNELVGAITELRDELAMKQFNKHYDKLAKAEQDAVREIYPQRISEAEPKRVGGK
jgi:biopolymer transport protein ExbD